MKATPDEDQLARDEPGPAGDVLLKLRQAEVVAVGLVDKVVAAVGGQAVDAVAFDVEREVQGKLPGEWARRTAGFRTQSGRFEK